MQAAAQPQRAPDGAPVHFEHHHPEQTTLHRLVQQRAASSIAHTEASTGAERVPPSGRRGPAESGQGNGASASFMQFHAVQAGTDRPRRVHPGLTRGARRPVEIPKHQTTAEGVETAGQLAAVRTLGCTAVQGFLLGKPMPATQIAPLIGGQLTTVRGVFVYVTVMRPCFMMGPQNAVISKVSRSEIRTTQVTDLVIDISIELGKLRYRHRLQRDASLHVVADRGRLLVLSPLVLAFLTGRIIGALGFQQVG